MKTAKIFDTIRFPVITEKSTNAAEKRQYVFDVAIKSTKPDIKSAVEHIYNVKVQSVNTLVRKGKTRVFKGRIGKQSDCKKAYVTLCENQKITIAEA